MSLCCLKYSNQLFPLWSGNVSQVKDIKLTFTIKYCTSKKAVKTVNEGFLSNYLLLLLIFYEIIYLYLFLFILSSSFYSFCTVYPGILFSGLYLINYLIT